MKRRTFISSVAIAAAAAHTERVLAQSTPVKGPFDELLKNARPAVPPDAIKAQFNNLLGWLKREGWVTYLKEVTGIELDGNADSLKDSLEQVLPDVSKKPGFEDFGGVRLIERGLPAMSLLYHALASPRVRPVPGGKAFSADQYPSPEQLDILENYIYALLDLNLSDADLKANYAVAVFAYEYRPAYKTPDDRPFADFMYSRTGIARIGEKLMNYDPVSRSFTNLPADPAFSKNVAVAPVRYGVFLAKKVSTKDADLYTYEHRDSQGMIWKTERNFLQPVRKLFDGDALTGWGTIMYAESHENQKLSRLADFVGRSNIPAEFDQSLAPFLKKSATDSSGARLTGHNTDLVALTKKGSSALLSSIPDRLIREATLPGGKVISFKVPAGTPGSVKSNRRYTSFRLQTHVTKNAIDYIRTEGLNKRYRATRFSAPRNAPMFANIRNQVDPVTYRITYIGPETLDFERTVFEGGYYTALFEDNICDGCVTAAIVSGGSVSAVLKGKLDNCFPAFSLVSAPDFFPLSESYDFLKFDDAHDTSFLEGGIENLSYCRLPPNPNIDHPLVQDRKAFVAPPKLTTGDQYQVSRPRLLTIPDETMAFDVSDTMIAMISGYYKPVNTQYDLKRKDYLNPEARDYQSNNFLTDSAAFVFAPGWDATYSSYNAAPVDAVEPFKFLATFGLGSPFPEDMKLCAAANGMWPVASPDAARTFMGSLEPIQTSLFNSQITPTAIPLLDTEIGIHFSHPALKAQPPLLPANFGWDGEQGPNLENANGRFWINFTDIGRADYVHNLGAAGPGFNMAITRGLTCTELIHRMEALRLCKLTIEGHCPKFSEHWLVSAEQVPDWTHALAAGIPADLVGNNRDWAATAQSGITKSGYLYVFADTIYDDPDMPREQYNWVELNGKRRRLAFKELFVCQIAGEKLAWCKIPGRGLSSADLLKWNNA